MVTTTGKKQTSAMIASLGTIPKPNHTTSSGAMIDDRHRLRGDEQRVDAAAQRAREVQRDGEQEAEHERDEDPEPDLLAR